MAIDIDILADGAKVTLAVSGEVDLYSSPDLRKAIRKQFDGSPETIVVDLSKVAYMDSSGVATLVEGLRAAAREKKTFELLSPSGQVRKVLQLSRLDTVFVIRDAP
jgi:anti-sigma B factor antagonist